LLFIVIKDCIAARKAFYREILSAQAYFRVVTAMMQWGILRPLPLLPSLNKFFTAVAKSDEILIIILKF
jgi:hypothetical protein